MMNNWDVYFHSICKAIASKSPCLSRKIGAILVRDKVVIATGYNGPARGVPHCGKDRFEKDEVLRDAMKDVLPADAGKIATTCPRQLLNYKSGEGLHICPAEHAERNCIASAARLGVSTKDARLYMNCVLPCKNCITLLINAGIREIVVEDITYYDKYSEFIYKHCDIKLRRFEL
jgi:dCMP deaminase